MLAAAWVCRSEVAGCKQGRPLTAHSAALNHDSWMTHSSFRLQELKPACQAFSQLAIQRLPSPRPYSATSAATLQGGGEGDPQGEGGSCLVPPLVTRSQRQGSCAGVQHGATKQETGPQSLPARMWAGALQASRVPSRGLEHR